MDAAALTGADGERTRDRTTAGRGRSRGASGHEAGFWALVDAPARLGERRRERVTLGIIFLTCVSDVFKDGTSGLNRARDRDKDSRARE